jgi:hypothetical protein
VNGEARRIFEKIELMILLIHKGKNVIFNTKRELHNKTPAYCMIDSHEAY